MTSILQEAKQGEDAIIRNRRSLHRNPELSFEEYQTAEFIRKELSALGIPFRPIGGTGTVAHIGKGERCIALRADIDALPIHEESGVEFHSQNPGKMHACGHDAHTAMLLGAAGILKRRENELGGVVKLIFQPGEEKLPGGASILIKEGVLKDPVPEAVFGQHVYPGATVGKLGFCSGALMASADELYWTIHGRSGHAAQPHLALDPIFGAAQLITQLQSVISRSIDPFEPGVLSITAINGGHATNVIPDAVEMKGTLRALDLDWRERALESITRQSTMLCESLGLRCDFRPVRGYPPLFNDATTTEQAATIARNLIGDSEVYDAVPKMWGEDFAFYAREVPATFWLLGIRPRHLDETPGLHNSRFIIDEEALHIGTAMMASVALERLQA